MNLRNAYEKTVNLLLKKQAPVVQRLIVTIQSYLMDSDLSSGECSPPFEQLGSGELMSL